MLVLNVNKRARQETMPNRFQRDKLICIEGSLEECTIDLSVVLQSMREEPNLKYPRAHRRRMIREMETRVSKQKRGK